MQALLLAALLAAAHAAVFMPELRLSALASTPYELLAPGTDAVELSGRQALTVVFSRPVIALGSDFGSADNYGGKVPFSLTCTTPGRFRWVTTAIARFDPDVDWPTDLDCEFRLNTSLTSYDGVPLQVQGPAARRVSTPPLSMQLQHVASEAASNLTDSLWDASVGLPDDLLPEVPSGSTMTLRFSSPASIKLLRAGLRLAPALPGCEIVVDQCSSPPSPPSPLPVFAFSAAEDAVGRSDEQEQARADEEVTCAQVKLTKALEPSVLYQLQLPAGARYSALSGPVRADTGFTLAGLRPFRLPFRTDFQMPSRPSQRVFDGVSFRRLALWLPHGLGPASAPEDLGARLRVCELVRAEPPTPGLCVNLRLATLALRRPSKGRVVVEVPALQPHRKYFIRALAAPGILDGFGQPLEASSAFFWTRALDAHFQGPSLSGGAPVAVFEPAAAPHAWPYVSRAATTTAGGVVVQGAAGNIVGFCSAASWPLDVRGQRDADLLVRLLVTLGRGDRRVEHVLGKPASAVFPSQGQEITQTHLDLAPDHKVHVVQRLCSAPPPNSDGRLASSDVQLVLTSGMAATLVVAPNREALVWVTHTGTAPGTEQPPLTGPLPGATVYLYLVQYNSFKPAGTCTTAAEGLCRVQLPAQSTRQPSVQVVAVVVNPAAGDTLYITDVSWWSSEAPRQPYVGKLVLDRPLVRPGDTLHITAYVQEQAEQGKLVMPVSPATGTVVVSLPWTEGDKPASASAPLSKDGSLHFELDVPSAAKVGEYQIELRVEPAPSDSSSTARAIALLARAAGTLRRRMLQGPEDVPVSGSAAVARPLGRPLSSKSSSSSPSSSVAWESVTVADPRPPTADLTIQAPTWAKPTARVPVQLQAVSYLGSSVANASMSVRWHTPKAQGVVDVTTDSGGRATATIDLALPAANATVPGDVLRVEAEWLGPTRERIVRTTSVNLYASSSRVELKRSLETDMPGVAWTPIVDVINNSDNQAVKGVPVEVSLTLSSKLQDDSSCPSPQPACSVLSGDWMPACKMQLPCQGNFVLRACTKEFDGACTELEVGRNASEWQAQPLYAHDKPSLRLAATEVAAGSTVKMAFENPWADTSVLLVWGNVAGALRTQLVAAATPGPTELQLPIGAECRGGCSVMAVVAVPRRRGPDGSDATCADGLGVPVSRLFDCYAPHTHTMRAQLRVVEDTTLDVALDVSGPSSGSGAAAVAAPGDVVRVRASASKDAAAVPGAEVTLVAVDKAVLDLLPLPLQDLSRAFQLSLEAQLHATSSDAYRVHPGAVEAVFATLLRRLDLDPQLPINTEITSKWGSSPVDESDEDFLARFTSDVTYMPSRFIDCVGRGPCPIMASDAVHRGLEFGIAGNGAMAEAVSLAASSKEGPAPSSSPSSASSASSASTLRVALDFKATPLFRVITTTTDGSGVAEFAAPGKLGTYVIRAYAASGSLMAYGQAEAQLVVRRTLSLTASLPRIVRVGDAFMAGVLITAAGNASAAPFAATVTCKVVTPAGATAPLALAQGTSTMVVQLTPQRRQEEVRFALAAGALGTATLQFHAEDGAGATDALEVTVPVLAQQSAVHVATSFAVRPAGPGELAQAQEGLQLPAAVAGSGALDITAGLGHLPAISSLYASIAAANEPGDEPSGFASATLATLPATMAAYQQPLGPAQLERAQQAMAGLARLTHPSYGLLPFTAESSWGWAPTRANIVLNAWASWLVSASASEPSKLDDAVAAQWGRVRAELLPGWQAALAQQLVADAKAARSPSGSFVPGPYSDLYSLAWAMLALGPFKVPLCGTARSTALPPFLKGTCSDATVQQDLSLDRLVAEAQGAGLSTRILTAMILHAAQPQPEHEAFVAAVADDLVSAIRVTARTAYVAASKGAARAAGYESQALALVLLTRLSRPSEAPVLLQKLAAHVAQQDRPGGAGFAQLLVTPSPMAVGLMVHALRTYDTATGSTTPSLQLQLSVGNVSLLEAKFTPSSRALAASSTPWEKLPSPPGTLVVQAEGTGEVSIAASLKFVPAALLPFPSYRGLYVEVAIRSTDPVTGSPVGPALSAVPLGTVVVVMIQVVSPDDVGPTTVEVLVPGGLEPVDPLLAPDVRGSSNICAWGDGPRRSSFPWPGICPSQETRPAAVTFRYAHSLGAGTHSLQFSAVSATEGVFQLPPVKASVDSQPEVMGMTAGGTFQVCGASCTARPVPATSPAKPCAPGCAAWGNGVCDISTGECQCQHGFMGPDCSTEVKQ